MVLKHFLCSSMKNKQLSGPFVTTQSSRGLRVSGQAQHIFTPLTMGTLGGTPADKDEDEGEEDDEGTGTGWRSTRGNDEDTLIDDIDQ